MVAGSISNAITLNRYAYANGNPVSNVDPFGLSAERGWLEKLGDGISGAVGAVVGAGTSAIGYRVSTGTWEGTGEVVIEGTAEGFADGFMSGGISYGVGMSSASLLKHSNGLQFGKTAKPQYGKVNALYGNPNKGGATFVSIQNNAGKRAFGLEADLMDSVHMHIPKLTDAHIPFSYATGTISGVKTGLNFFGHDDMEEEKPSRK